MKIVCEDCLKDLKEVGYITKDKLGIKKNVFEVNKFNIIHVNTEDMLFDFLYHAPIGHYCLNCFCELESNQITKLLLKNK